jgi:hypothetical protein
MGTGNLSDETAGAKQIGLDLLAATARFDRPMGVTRGGGPVDLALIAFAVRGRRLMRAAYRLLDANEPDAANVLLRVMTEYLIVGRWLLKAGADGMTAWALDDLRERRNVIMELLNDAAIDQEPRANLEAELVRTESAIRGYGGPAAALSKRAAATAGEPSAPGLQAMAREIGFGFAYSFAYRLQSQTDVHATPLAIDTVFEDVDPSEPGPRMRPIPGNALRGFDLYIAGAHLLLDILRPLTERVPELEWKPPLDDIERRLQIASAESFQIAAAES